MSSVYRFQINGDPGPQGSKRHVGHGVMIESSKKVKPWREATTGAARAVMRRGFHQIQGGVHVQLVFYFTRPAGHYGTGRNANRLKASAPEWPMGKTVHGDIEKLARSTFDGISDAGLWGDDKQVVACELSKVYIGRGAQPGAVVVVTDIDAFRSEMGRTVVNIRVAGERL